MKSIGCCLWGVDDFECVVYVVFSKFYDLVDDVGVWEDCFGCVELLGYFEFGGVEIDGDDLFSVCDLCVLDGIEVDIIVVNYDNVWFWMDFGFVDGGVCVC